MARWRRVTGGLAAGVLMTCCGHGATQQPFHGDTEAYLLGIDQLRDAGFSTLEPPAHISGGDLAAADRAGGTRIAALGVESAARVRFFRSLDDIALSNGPVDVTASVMRFRDQGTASVAIGMEIRSIDHGPGEAAISTGPLGDEAHATQLMATDPTGTRLVQFTLQWRLGNLVDELVVRGRYGGARIADALALAARETDNELGVATTAPAAAATATATATAVTPSPRPSGGRTATP